MCREHVPYFNKKLSSDSLTEVQIDRLAEINASLAAVESRIVKEAVRIHKSMKKRLSGDKDGLEDYNLDYKITFYVGEDDPDYLEDDDNILIEISEDLSFKMMQFYLNENFGLGSGFNHNEFAIFPEAHPLKEQHHCWLFHCLYDHNPIGWLDILRISGIWLDIYHTLQFYEKL